MGADKPEVVALVDKMSTLLISKTPAQTVKKYLRGDRVYPSISARQTTGRLSTTKPGMTVFGSREERLVAQKSIILPDQGEVLISIDLSQIDARCMAAGSGDANYAALFEQGRDSHTEMAARVFGDPARRKDAKALAHAANYGMGAATFARNAGIPLHDAEVQLAMLREEFPQLEQFKNHLREQAEAMGYITTGFGRRVAVSPDRAYTQVPAAYGQGTARDVFLEGVLALPSSIASMIRIFVHDEVVLSVPQEQAEVIKSQVIKTFESVLIPGAEGIAVPTLADSAGPAIDWSGCK